MHVGDQQILGTMGPCTI